jgi:hypothetical protein
VSCVNDACEMYEVISWCRNMVTVYVFPILSNCCFLLKLTFFCLCHLEGRTCNVGSALWAIHLISLLDEQEPLTDKLLIKGRKEAVKNMLSFINI